MIKFISIFIQLILLVIFAPLVSGFIAKIKNNLRMKKGAPVFQPYYDLGKLFLKSEVVSETASWIFRAAPFIALAATVSALSLTAAVVSGSPASFAGEFLAIIFILALARFFIALAGLDAGSPFGGMGSSREMFVSSLAEPAACLAVFALSLQPASTNPEFLGMANGLRLANILAAFSLFMVLIAETSRLPVDNQETHLELTMIHEAMVLEYSGRSLALIGLAGYLKQMIWLTLLGQIIFPTTTGLTAGFIPLAGAGLIFILKTLVIAGVIAVMEIRIAKMRLFRVLDYFGFAVVLGILATVAAIIRI
jgi:formate hydrogenlyase subunit 4